MSAKSMQLKAKINNYAKSKRLPAQVVLQNYMFERFLERLSNSNYNKKFVIKGGMLIATIVGLDIRSTMDLDTTLINLPLNEGSILKAVESICAVNVMDEIKFEVLGIEPIRHNDKYGGYRIKLHAKFESITTPLTIDISTGDIITYAPIEYEFYSVIDNNVHFLLWGYNLETVMAEKMETILSRGIFNTRPRDFYDVYVLEKHVDFHINIFKEAILATAQHRGSIEIIKNYKKIIPILAESKELERMWHKYQSKYAYAKDISYNLIILSLQKILEESLN